MPTNCWMDFLKMISPISWSVLVNYDNEGNLSSNTIGYGKGEVETTTLEEYIKE